MYHNVGFPPKNPPKQPVRPAVDVTEGPNIENRFGEDTTQGYAMYEGLPVWGSNAASGRQPIFDINQGNDNSITSGKIIFFVTFFICIGNLFGVLKYSIFDK